MLLFGRNPEAPAQASHGPMQATQQQGSCCVITINFGLNRQYPYMYLNIA